jgi:DNA-binding transcriptional ArsR family regulator
MVVNQTVKYNPATDPLSAIFAALADPTRRSILARLSERDVTVNELAQPYDISLPAVSRHLKVLEKAGLISRTKKAQWRSCRLETESLKEVNEWLETYREHWEQRLTHLDTYLQQIQK